MPFSFGQSTTLADIVFPLLNEHLAKSDHGETLFVAIDAFAFQCEVSGHLNNSSVAIR